MMTILIPSEGRVSEGSLNKVNLPFSGHWRVRCDRQTTCSYAWCGARLGSAGLRQQRGDAAV